MRAEITQLENWNAMSIIGFQSIRDQVTVLNNYRQLGSYHNA